MKIEFCQEMKAKLLEGTTLPEQNSRQEAPRTLYVDMSPMQSRVILSVIQHNITLIRILDQKWKHDTKSLGGTFLFYNLRLNEYVGSVAYACVLDSTFLCAFNF